MALGCPETAFEGLGAFAAADLLRARQAAAKSDAATFGDAVAHARHGRDRLVVQLAPGRGLDHRRDRVLRVLRQ